MPPFGPIKRRDLISYLRQLGFNGPYRGKRHAFLQRDTTKLPLPNPHSEDIRPRLLAQILREAGISREEWERL